MRDTLKKHQFMLICLALAAATIGVYWQVIHFKFVSFDDNWYIYKNNFINDGLTQKSIAWAFSFADQAWQTYNWHPLTSLSHILDIELYGLNASGHHLTSMLFHTANVLLLFVVLHYMTAKPWRSAFVAALFALHPLHVESVAWVSERKDVLSLFFGLLTIYSYAWYTKHRKIHSYILSLLLFAACLMSKPMLVTLPFILLLLDYWPLGRFNRVTLVEGSDNRRGIGRLIVEKIPYLILSATSCFITIKVQIWAVLPPAELPMKLRLLNVPISYVKYIEKMFWPSHLAFFYPYRRTDISLLYFLISLFLLLTISFLVLLLGRRRKYLPVGWFWYLGTLVPVIGIIQVGRQAIADRYTYIPLTGLFIIITWGVADLLAKIQYRRIIFSVSTAIVLFALGAAAWLQAGFWRDDVALYKRATEAVKDNEFAYQLLGNALHNQGRLDEAINSYKEALRIRSDSIEVLNDLVALLIEQGKYDEIIALYGKALPELPDDSQGEVMPSPLDMTSLGPEDAKKYEIIRSYSRAHNNLGVALESQGKLDEAIRHYREALRFRSDYTLALKNLGYAYFQQGKYNQSIEQLEKLLQLEPYLEDVRMNLTYALFQSERYDEAITHIREYIRVEPDSVAGYQILAKIYLKQGNKPDAVEALKKAEELAEASGESDSARLIQEQIKGLESK